MERLVTSENIGVFADEVKKTLEPKNTATILTFSGDLGAGKTTFTQALAQSFGVKETITSPTFVLIKKYPLSGQMFENFIHIDAYRLKGSNELMALGWNELLADPQNIIVLEWPECVPECIPEHAQKFIFTHKSETERKITYGE